MTTSSPKKNQVIVEVEQQGSSTEPVITIPDTAVKKDKPRIYYLDKLRLFLTFLVVTHHCFWVVVNGWHPFYRPWQLDIPTIVLSYMILSANQAYFMGMFFFLSGLVTGPSLQRKGSWMFIKDRFVRLIVPVVLYELVVFPLLFCFVEATWSGPRRGATATMGEVWAYYFANYIFTNSHMWFLVTLFAVSGTAVNFIMSIKSWKEFVFSQHSIEPVISRKDMILILLKLSSVLFVLNYLMRLPFPQGYVWIPVWGNLGFLAQYLVAFAVGILANSYQFLDHLRKDILPFTLIFSFISFFLFEIFQTFMFDVMRQSIGFYAQTLFTTLFEQFYAVFWSYSLLVLFKEYQNVKPSEFVAKLISSAYATYIIHQWIIISLAIGLAYTNLHPLLVIVILCITATPLSWGAGLFLKAIPGSSRIL